MKIKEMLPQPKGQKVSAAGAWYKATTTPASVKRDIVLKNSAIRNLGFSMNRKKNLISAQDRELFRRAVADVLPLRQDKVLLPQRRLAPIPRQREQDEARVIRDLLSDTFEPAELETGEELFYLRPGLQRRLLRHLRQGKFSIGAELDLHGMTVPIARQMLARFLEECRRNAIQSVRIIHGKGRGSYHKEPILKGKVNLWLQQRDEVLAFCSARAADGGTGAVYVLLKRRR
jgi:DNA-nicking Smr family endonuclease